MFITLQGNKVRDLKAAKAEKSKITAEVKTLLALKAQLTAGSSESTGAPNAAGGSQSKDATTAPLSGGKCDQGEIDRLTEEVKVQVSYDRSTIDFLLYSKHGLRFCFGLLIL